MSEQLTDEQYAIIREWATYHYGRPIADATMDDLRRRLKDDDDTSRGDVTIEVRWGGTLVGWLEEIAAGEFEATSTNSGMEPAVFDNLTGAVSFLVVWYRENPVDGSTVYTTKPPARRGRGVS
jgi:hypothetical protein